MDQRFEQLLLEYVEEQDGSRRLGIQEKLWAEFGATRAVLVMDLSRFSILTEKYGIVYNLAIIRRMQTITRPLIEMGLGNVVKFEADNCFAMFNDVSSAINAAISINRAFRELNQQTQEPFDINVGIGIDYGEVLLVGGPDYFGATVNRASKLGEDIASAGEILVTEVAFQHLGPESGFSAEPLDLSISGLSLKARSIKY